MVMQKNPKKRNCIECGKLRVIFSKGRCRACANKEYAEKAKANRKRNALKNKKRKTTRSKTSRRSVSSLKKKLWRIFSIFIRLRDSDKDGVCSCITCGFRERWNSGMIDAGHFRSRKHSNTLFHEKNVHAQCKKCNGFGAGEQYIYGKELDERYGEGTADELTQLSRQSKSFTIYELENLIKYYQEEIEKLKSEKNYED